MRLSFPVSDASAGETESHSLSIDWGGRIKAVGKQYYPDSDSIYADIDKGPYNEGSVDGRLAMTLISGAGAQLDVHYESVYIKGDLQKIRNNLTNVSSETNPLGSLLGDHVDDDRRLERIMRECASPLGHAATRNCQAVACTAQAMLAGNKPMVSIANPVR